MSFKLLGALKLIAALKLHGEKSDGYLGAALFQEGLAIMAKSVPQVPVETGRLRATAYVSPPRKASTGPFVRIGYGTNYGVYVHERTDVAHPVGKPKFLQDPLNQARSGYVKRLAGRVERNMRTGTVAPPVSAYKKGPE